MLVHHQPEAPHPNFPLSTSWQVASQQRASSTQSLRRMQKNKRETERRCNPLAPLRPEHALVAARHRADALIDEFLYPLTLVSFSRVEIPLGIGRNAVYAVELAWLAAAIAERGYFLERFAHNDADALVLTVCQQEEFLPGILGERDIANRSRPARGVGIKRFLHECSIRGEDLQSIISAVTDIDEPVIRTFDAVYRVAKLLRGRS